MKAQLTKVSLALLSTVFLFGCQEQGSGPVGPEGLGPEFHHGKGGHAGGGEEGDKFLVTVSGEDISGGPKESTGEGIIVNFALALPFFQNKLTCDLLLQQTGTLVILASDAGGPHVHVGLTFLHNETKHRIGLLGTKPDNWPPAADNPVTLTQLPPGDWEVTTKGKNHQNGCTGEGDGIVFTVTIDPVTT